jgi:hypothetical protein
MTAPIIIYNFGDVLVFGSIESAERYLEAIDVENNEYIGYDGTGRLLELGTDGSHVIIRAAEACPTHQNDLRKILIEYLAQLGLASDWLLYASLEQLVAKGLEFRRE